MPGLDWTVGTFDLPQQQAHVQPQQLQPPVPPQDETHVQEQEARPPVDPEVLPQSQETLEPEPEGPPVTYTCERADARLPPASREIVTVSEQVEASSCPVKALNAPILVPVTTSRMQCCKCGHNQQHALPERIGVGEVLWLWQAWALALHRSCPETRTSLDSGVS